MIKFNEVRMGITAIATYTAGFFLFQVSTPEDFWFRIFILGATGATTLLCGIHLGQHRIGNTDKS